MTKKILLLAVAFIMVAAVALPGCAASQSTAQDSTATQTADAQPTGDTAAQTADTSATDTETAGDDTAQADPEAIPYAFEFKDVDGNVHKLSDYKGKPVYLEIWASWCSVCKSGMPDIDELSATAEDFYVLTVVAPGYYGEKQTDAFIDWWADQGYENMTVLVDEEHQVIFDFGVQAFPSQVFFDADSNFVGGRIGLMTPEQIVEQMTQIAQK